MGIESATDRLKVRELLSLAISTPEDVPKLAPRELDLLIRVARRTRLLGRIGTNLRQSTRLSKLPTHAVDQLESAAIYAGARMDMVAWEMNRVVAALPERLQTRVILLKGCAYQAMGIPTMAGRVVADVDILTDVESLPEVEAFLNDNGWKSKEISPYDDNYYRRWTHEIPPLIHESRVVEVDLHFNILPQKARLKPDANRLIECSVMRPGSALKTLSNEDVVLHAMAHLMFDSDLADALRDLVDLADLIDYLSAQDNEFLSRLVERAQTLRLERPTYYSIRYLDRLLGYKFLNRDLNDAACGAPNRLVLWLMDRIVPRALFPMHPDRTSPTTSVCRFLLFVRSNWIRLPPHLLTYHWAHKTFVGARKRNEGKDS